VCELFEVLSNEFMERITEQLKPGFVDKLDNAIAGYKRLRSWRSMPVSINNASISKDRIVHMVQGAGFDRLLSIAIKKGAAQAETTPTHQAV
jgi:hypothetical protein